METATFAAGCFWGVEIDFANIRGVTRTSVGYTGGSTENPSYEDVCTGRTGHAEAVEIEYDPDQIGFGDLVDRFFALHDPTQVDRQGPDVGTQYRSAIFAHSAEQEADARAGVERAAARLGRPVATEIVSAVEFYPAEEYHQRYLEKRGMATCAVPASA